MRIPEIPRTHITNILENYDRAYGLKPTEDEYKEIEKLSSMYEKAFEGLIKKISARVEQESGTGA